MIVHEVKIGKKPANQITKREHRKIYIGCAESDIRYRDMLVNFRHRWEFYTKPTIDFLTYDWNKSELKQQKTAAKKIIHGSDGVMFIISANTEIDPIAIWEIDCAISKGIPITGVDVGKNPEGKIPDKLIGKMTKYGWEWFAMFINQL
jgi:hypothetical protein